MKNSLVKLGLLACLGACTKAKPAEQIVIEGNVQNIQNGKVYLADAHSWKRLDSTQCQDGRFRFTLTPDSSFTPQMVSIHYTANKPVFDTTTSTEQLFKRIGHRMLLLRNHTIRNPDSLRAAHVRFSSGSTAFFLTQGHTQLEGDAQSEDGIRVIGNRETDVMFSLLTADFGWLGNLEGAKRAAKISFFKNKITQNPYSYYLLQEIYNYKEQYTEQELRELVGSFNPEVQQSTFGRKVNQYLVTRIDSEQPYPNLSLVGPDKQKGWLMDNGAKVNMLVFWASWCGPCRQEIPQLKALYAHYKDRGVHLVSVSIDEKPENWQQALGQEQMGWPQLLVGKEQIEQVKQKFNFNAIPFILVTDSRGKELKRFSGYEDNNEALYRKVLEEKLSEKPE
ncbi:TlpA disulfide reductase family protein [Hymenobacter setariae]|nr:TlpA disulfide reductase family protein [Hymenobacter setariae]